MIKQDTDGCTRLPAPTFVFNDGDALTLEWCYGGGPGHDHWAVYVYWGSEGVEGSRVYGRFVDGTRTITSDVTNDWATVVKWLAEEPEGLHPAELELERQIARRR